MTDDEHETRVALLLEKEPRLKSWLDSMRSIVKDRQGVTVVLGLTPAETEEFLLLNPIVNYQENGRLEPEFKAASARYWELHKKHDCALKKDAMENLEHYLSEKKTKQ
ncbi:MAG TPA: hypothetical protein VIG36_04575 [Methylocystis sp.]|jgi:hypothetical protein